LSWAGWCDFRCLALKKSSGQKAKERERGGGGVGLKGDVKQIISHKNTKTQVFYLKFIRHI
jgi:hypothetical protein